MGANLRHYVQSGDVWTCAARVEAWDNAELDTDGTPLHYETNEEGDVVIHCKLHRGGTSVKANMGPIAGGRGAGIWIIPDVGTEVMIASDHGDFEGELYLIGMFPTGKSVPTKPGQVLIIGMDIQARTREGVAKKLATTDDVDALRSWVATEMTLPVSGVTAGPGASPSPPTASGTKTFKAE